MDPAERDGGASLYGSLSLDAGQLLCAGAASLHLMFCYGSDRTKRGEMPRIQRFDLLQGRKEI